MRSFATVLLPALLLIPSHAFAHATPVTYEPEASAVIGAAPAEVVIRFSERIEEKTSSIRILRPDGGRVDAGDARLDADDAHVYRTRVATAGTGSYTVVWQVVSADDGHFTKGAYTFSVGMADEASDDTAQFGIVHSSTVREAFAIGSELLGQAILLGLLVALLLFWSARKNDDGIASPSIRRMTFIGLAGAGLIVAGVFLYLLQKAGDLSAVQATPFSTAFMQFLSTVAGSMAAYRGGLAVLFLLLFLPMRRMLRRPLAMTLLFAVVLAMMFLRARVSHAAASDFLPSFSVSINFLHLIAKSLWVGSLVSLIFLVFPSLAAEKRMHAYADLFTCCSAFLSWIVGCTAVTGLYIIWLHVKEPGNVWGSLWGSRFLYLSAFAVVLVLFRLYHHFIVNPMLVRATTHESVWRSKILRTSGATLIMEMLTGVVVLFFSGALIITTPPLTHAPVRLGEAESQGMRVQLGEYAPDANLLLVSVDGKQTEVAQITDVTVALTNVREGIGPIVVKTEKRFEGGYVFPVKELSLPGDWSVDLTVQRSSSYDAVASFHVDYPDQLEEAKAASERRSFGMFEWLLFAAAIAAIGFTVFLSYFAKTLHAKLQPDKVMAEAVPTLAFGALWKSTVLATTVLLFAVGFHVRLIGSNFRDTCKEDGFYWHENVPMRDGKATSNKATLGCMMGFGKGMFHLTDAREFAYFDRPAIGIASLRADPERIVAGNPTTLAFGVRDGKGEPAQGLALSHDRILHIVIASDDFSVFDHIHAENGGPVTEEMLKTAVFPATYTFPKAGRYIVAVDFTIRAQEFAQEFYVDVEGSPRIADGQPQLDTARTQVFDGYTVTLDAPATIRAKNGVRLSYVIQKDGKPIEDLQPYLAAPMHLAVMRDDLRYFSHGHGQLPRSPLEWIIDPSPPTRAHASMSDSFGPVIEAGLVFPVPGRYVLFGEFRHQGKRVVTKFAVEVK